MAFDKAGNLRTHQSRVHSEKRFTCAECAENMEAQSSEMADDSAKQDVSFPTYASLQNHIRIVHPPKCPECPLVCSTARGLRQHLEIAHGNVTLEERKIYPCTVPGCGQSFTKQGNLTVHVRTVHQGEKRFVCGETDLSKSTKLDGWDGVGCGKRYGNTWVSRMPGNDVKQRRAKSRCKIPFPLFPLSRAKAMPRKQDDRLHASTTKRAHIVSIAITICGYI